MTPSALAKAVACCVVVPLSSALSQQSPRDEPERPEVRELRITGVRAFDKDLVEQSIATEESGCKSFVLAPFCLVSKSTAFYRRAYLDRDELRRDVLRIRVFYWRRGYREAEVDTIVRGDNEHVRVTLRVTEGEPTRISSVRVTQSDPQVLTPRELRRALQVRAGEPLDLLALDSSIVLLRNEMWELGYSDARVRIDTVDVVPERRAAAVRITVVPRWRAHVERVTITGNERVSRRTILQSMELHEGDLYRRSDLIESQRNLYASNLFSHAAIVVPPQGDSLKHIEVTVTEAPLRRIRTSGGFNTIDFVQLEGRFTHYNWLGGGRRLDLRAAVGNLLAPQLNGNFIFRDVTPIGLDGDEERVFLRPEFQASAEISQPVVGSARNSIGLSAFTHRRSEPGIFVDQGFGGSASFTRMLRQRFPASLSYRFELTEVIAGDLYFCVNYGVCERPTIAALSNRQALSPVSLSMFRDISDDPLNPRRGSLARFDAEHASGFTLSDFRYNRVSGDYAHYFPIGSRAVLAARARAGWVRSLESTATASGLGSGSRVLHPRKRFYAGGSQSVRGYGENQLGPRILTIDPQQLLDAGCTTGSIADGTCDPNPVSSGEFQPRPTGGTSLLEGSVEYRFPVWKKLYGAVFVDGAFVGSGPFEDVTSGTGALTPGFGFRYLSPVGPIRVDLGVRPTLREDLVVVTERLGADGEPEIVPLRTLKRYDPVEGGGGFRQVLNRLTLHLSIGQAY